MAWFDYSTVTIDVTPGAVRAHRDTSIVAVHAQTLAPVNLRQGGNPVSTLTSDPDGTLDFEAENAEAVIITILGQPLIVESNQQKVAKATFLGDLDTATDAAIDRAETAGRLLTPAAAAAGYTPKNQLGLSALQAGAVGNGTTVDTTALQAAMNSAATFGIPLVIPAGKTFRSGPLTMPTNLDLRVLGVLDFSTATATSSGYLSASGTEATARNLTANATAGALTVTVASGHGIIAGDLVRVASDAVFDASSTSSKIGELVYVRSVTSTVLTLTTPLQDSYATANTARVSKITPVTGIRISGSGVIKGARNNTKGESGLVVRRAVDVQITGVTFDGFDTRHLFFPDCIEVRVRDCTFTWGQSDSGYAVSFSNASQDCEVAGCTFTYLRHSLSTNNEAASPGVVRRIWFHHNTISDSALSNGGTGGDAIDTHTAAEDIWIEHNLVLRSTGQGINFECRSGRVVFNRVNTTASHGIAVHNESDRTGVVQVTGNTVTGAGDRGLYVIPGTRGTAAWYEGLDVSGNVVLDAAGIGIQVGTAATSNRDRAVTVTGNRVFRAGGTVGMTIENIDGGSIVGNTVWDGLSGIQLSDVQHFSYSGNTCRNNTATSNYLGHRFDTCVNGTIEGAAGRATGTGSVGVKIENTSSNLEVGVVRFNATTQLDKGTATGIRQASMTSL